MFFHNLVWEKGNCIAAQYIFKTETLRVVEWGSRYTAFIFNFTFSFSFFFFNIYFCPQFQYFIIWWIFILITSADYFVVFLGVSVFLVNRQFGGMWNCRTSSTDRQYWKAQQFNCVLWNLMVQLKMSILSVIQ